MPNGALGRLRFGAFNESARPRYFTTERKIQAGFAFALACLAIVAAMSYWSVLRLKQNAAWVEHTHEVLSRLDSLQSITTDGETAERGYVITGDEAYLEPYRQAVRLAGTAERRLDELTADNKAQQQRVKALKALVDGRLEELRAVIQIRQTQGLDAAQRQILTGTGKRIHDQIRSRIDEIKSAETTLLAERERRTHRSTVVMQSVITAGGSLAFAFVGLASWVIRRDLLGRQRAQAALCESHEQLELRVAQRTAELALANESLQNRERRFRALVERSSDSIALIDCDSRYVYLSPAVTTIEGYSPEQLLGQVWTERAHPEDLPHIEDSLQVLRHHPSTPIALQWRQRHRDGQWIWLEGVATHLLRDPAIQAIVINYRDVTSRKESESKLQAQLARLDLLGQITRAIGERQDIQSIFQVVIRTLEEHLPVDFSCICRYDAHANRLTVTTIGRHSELLALELAMTEQAHIDIDENGLSRCVRGRLVYEPDIREVPFPFPQQLARGGLESLVAAPLLVESQVFGVLITARRKARTFSSGECEFLRQVSEHVALATHQAQLYSALQRAYEDLRHTQQAMMQQERLLALGQMASGIAHDINNAVSPIALYTEALLESQVDLSPRARNYVEIIQRAIDDVGHTVARMREFYRQREPQALLQPVDLNALVRQVIDLTRARWSDMAQQRGVVIEIRLQLTPDLPSIMGAEAELRDAFTNLIFNAVDAMPQGGPLTLRTRLILEEGRFAPEDPGHQLVQLEVIDAGVGMDEDTRRRCLEPFFTTKGERGTGLGLAMVYGAMQRHNADIEIESTLGEGTLVRLSFPAPGASAGHEPTVVITSIVTSLRILIVDDDPLILKSLRDALELDGHLVTLADGGQTGIDMFHAARATSDPFQVVITDLGMPYVDGRKVANAVKAAAPETVVLLLTGWGQRLLSDRDIPPDVDRVLNKPPKLRELREALASCLAPRAP